jgi:triacylglycerol lipase
MGHWRFSLLNIKPIQHIFITGIVLILIIGCIEKEDSQSKPKKGKKEIPIITLKNLSPPYKEYDYFQGTKKYAFQYKATSFSLINAWWLSEVSTLVYADEEFVRSQFKKAGIPEVKFFDKLSTQCYVANNGTFAVVAFRGSEIWKKREKIDLNQIVADLKADVDIRLVDWPQGGKVHRGFKEALDEVWPDLLPYISELDDRGRKIWMTGHSLGGALATLCGERYGNVQGVYTFGSPWVGDGNFKEHVNVRVYRIVNNEDIVSRLLSFGVFEYVGELKFIDSDGIIRNTMDEYKPPVNNPRDETYGQGTSGQGKNSFAGFIPAPFRDHVPLLYSVRLWNDLIENPQ